MSVFTYTLVYPGLHPITSANMQRHFKRLLAGAVNVYTNTKAEAVMMRIRN